MSIFGADKKQDERLDAIEEHLRAVTGDLARARIAIANIRADIMSLKSALREKVAADDLDPAILDFNENLGKARVTYERLEQATLEQWDSAQQQLSDSLKSMEEVLEEVPCQVG